MTTTPTTTTTTNSPRLLIAGVGNIFLGDDAFGVEVVQRLARREQPEGVTVADFGIRGIDLTYALLDDGYDALVLVDAVPRQSEPGTLYVIEPDPAQAPTPNGDPAAIIGDDPGPGQLMLDTHNMDPEKVLRLTTALGGRLERVLLLGCEPSPPATSYEEMAAGLSGPVAAAVDQAITMAEDLARQTLDELQDKTNVDQPMFRDDAQNLGQVIDLPSATPQR